MFSFLLLLTLQIYAAYGFLPSWIPGAEISSAPELQRYTQTTGNPLDVRLIIGIDDKMFTINGMKIQFSTTLTTRDESCSIPLPGADGPRPHLSNGVHQVNVLKDGTFINMEGQQTVELHDGVWEMIWRDNSSAGLIICGFTLDKDAVRNDAKLERGIIYMSWPVWSNDELQNQQKRKAKAEKKYDKFQLERDTQLEKMNDTRNILQKALHFRNAAAATEQMDYTGLHYMVDIPSKDDVVEVGNGLQMVKSGTIWKKAGSFDSFRASKHHVLLGSCTVGN